MVDALTPAALPTTGVTVTTPVPAAVSGVAPVAASVTNAPDAVATTTRQIQISGLIAEPPSGNIIVINTPAGQVTLTLNQLAAEQQPQLTQQLLTAFQNQRPVSALIQPGRQPPQAVLLIPQSALTPSIITPQTTSTIALPAINVGDVLNAVLLPSITPLATQPQTTATLNPLPSFPQTTITLPQNSNSAPNIPTPQLPTGGYAPASPVPTGLHESVSLPVAAAAYAHTDELVPTHLSIVPTGTNAPAQTATIVSSGTTILPVTDAKAILSSLQIQPGQPVNLRVDAILSGNNPVPSLQPNQLLATVIGKGTNDSLIVQAGTAQFFVRQPTDSPVGSVFVVTVSKADVAAAAQTVADHSSLVGLQQLLAAVAQIDPALAKQLSASIIPQPNAQLPGTLLFFMNALKQGDFQGWLGAQTVNRLAAAGKQNLIARLVQDIKAATHTTRDMVVGEWISYPIPLRQDHVLNMLTLYVHSDPRDTADEAPTNGTKTSKVRFVIDVTMSRIGSIQLDGLSRPRHLDMIIRSERALPGHLPGELRAIYTQTLEAMGYSGSILFQPGRRGWVVMQGKETSREI
jgi:hypothetical protein